MSSRIRESAVIAAAITGLLALPDRAPCAEEGFRVESKVFVGSDKEPKSESTTIFCRGLVYDYLKTPAEIIVLDAARGRFLLLDPGRRVRTEMTTQEVVGLTENLRKWAAMQTDSYLKFLSAPTFEEQPDEKTGELVFQSPWLTYRVAAIDAENESVVEQYRDFCDWYAKLNARLNPGYKLVFARLAINEAISRRRQVPREITLTMPKKALSLQKSTIRSEHQFIPHLVESDRDRIAQTSEFLAIFRPVEFAEYEKKPGP
jgi:hypothetical protein